MLYGAYGSNLNIGQMKARCPHSTVVGTADLKNWQLMFRRTFLDIEPAKRKKVPLGIWEVPDDDLPRLDYYEGYPDFYGRRVFDLKYTTLDGEEKEGKVFIYIMQPGFQLSLPTGRYLKVCFDGCDNFGLGKGFIRAAYRRTLEQLRNSRLKELEKFGVLNDVYKVC